MILGIVTDLQARIEIAFRLPDQADRTVEGVVDTGFQGEIALPPGTVAALGLPAGGQIWANLADDTDVPVPIFRGVILWDGRERPVTVMAMGKRPLLGAELLQGFNLSADLRKTGRWP